MEKKIFKDRRFSMKKRMKAYLDDVANFYNSGNRATDENGTCIYDSTYVSPGCAIGKELTDKELNIRVFEEPIRNIDCTVDLLYNEEVLPKWMMDFDVEFLLSLQNLHDDEKYWNEEGLSNVGMFKYNNVCENFDLH